MFVLAGEAPQTSSSLRVEDGVDAGLQGFIDLLSPNPARVINRCFDVVAWNRAEDALLGPALGGGLGRIPRARRNLLYMVFIEPLAREMLPDWEREARWLTGLLRAESAHELGSPRFIEVVNTLERSSPEFREWWTSHDVQKFTPSTRRFNHPAVGVLSLNYVRLAVEGDEGRSIIAHFALPGSSEEELLGRLLAAAPDDVAASVAADPEPEGSEA
ncbi:hypothetical protein [Streptomyces sp. NPDC093544]|uniref:MmyB family transcriptional regulator n=1 Tax=Streptomyces sp. NPDC093544 TaxID=3155200 RepID=UPI00342A3CB2